MDLNNQIQMLENENLEKDKTIENSQSKAGDSNKQIEIKDKEIDEMIKKNNLLDQEKEQLFIDYQKKIEELQLQVLDSASNAMDSTSGLCKVIDILNSNVDEFKNIFKKKIDNFEDIFDKFKSEYIKRDESFTFLLNDKTKEFNEFINKFIGGAQGDVQNVFNNVNNSSSDIKDKKIDWLNKQVTDLTEYKNKIIEYENKFKDLNVLNVEFKYCILFWDNFSIFNLEHFFKDVIKVISLFSQFNIIKFGSFKFLKIVRLLKFCSDISIDVI